MDLLPTINNIADLRTAADIIEEKTELVTFLGFCKPGTTSESEAGWSILKIIQSGTVKPITTRFLWAEGFCFYNLSWTDRNLFNYQFKKF